MNRALCQHGYSAASWRPADGDAVQDLVRSCTGAWKGLVAVSYRVVISRENDAWLADVPSVRGAHTYARSIDVLLKSIVEVIILMADLPVDSPVEVEPEYDLSDELVARALELGRARAELVAREAELQSATSAIVTELSNRGFTVRDCARLLDLTPGRISQIANA